MNRRAWLLLTILAAVWGSSYLLIKVALDDGVPPVFVVCSRVALGAAVLAALAVRSGILGLILILCDSWFAAEGRIPGLGGASAEADLAVGARSRLGALDEVQALDRRLEQPCDQP